MNNIRYESDERVEFQDIEIGDAFIMNGELYIKTDVINDTERNVTWNAFCLTTDINHVHITSHEYVRAVDLEILVKG